MFVSLFVLFTFHSNLDINSQRFCYAAHCNLNSSAWTSCCIKIRLFKDGHKMENKAGTFI